MPSDVVLRPYTSGDIEAVRHLLLADGWGARAEDRDRLARIIDAASAALVAESNGQVIGFGRCISDGISNGYLSMLIVDPAYRRRGVGRSIVMELMGDDPGMTWVLRAGHPGSDAFWGSIGFARSEIAYERPRTL